MMRLLIQNNVPYIGPHAEALKMLFFAIANCASNLLSSTWQIIKPGLELILYFKNAHLIFISAVRT